MIQDACITRKKRKAKKDPFGTFVSFCPSSALHLVHSNLRTIFLVVLACVQAVPRNIWGYWGHPSGRQEFHFFTDFSISQGKLFAFLWNTGLVWPPKPACTRQRVTFCNSKKPKQEVSQRTAVKANERNFMSVFQTFQTFSNSVLDNAARLLLVVSSLSLCAQRSFASLVLRHLRLSGEAHMVASRQSFPVVARERCLQTICHCVRYPCLVGSVLPALSAVGVARLRDVDHGAYHKASFSASFRSSVVQSWRHWRHTFHEKLVSFSGQACCPTQVPSTDFLDPNSTCQETIRPAKTNQSSPTSGLCWGRKHSMVQKRYEGVGESWTYSGLNKHLRKQYKTCIKCHWCHCKHAFFANSSAGHTQGIELHERGRKKNEKNIMSESIKLYCLKWCYLHNLRLATMYFTHVRTCFRFVANSVQKLFSLPVPR